MKPKSFDAQDHPSDRPGREGRRWRWAVAALSGAAVVLVVALAPRPRSAEAQFGGGAGGMRGPMGPMMGPPANLSKIGDRYINLSAVTFAEPAGEGDKGLQIHFVGGGPTLNLSGDDAEAFRVLIEGPEPPPGGYGDMPKKEFFKKDFQKKKEFFKKEFPKKEDSPKDEDRG